MADRKRRHVGLFIIPLFVGLMGLFRVMESPQFESYRTLDVVQLFGAGACFGIAFTGVILMLLLPRP